MRLANLAKARMLYSRRSAYVSDLTYLVAVSAEASENCLHWNGISANFAELEHSVHLNGDIVYWCDKNSLASRFCEC